jgi:hypothetical protein
MPSTAIELCDAAIDYASTVLATVGTVESQRRSAISRLYYGAFHLCHDFHCNLPIPGSVGDKSGVHEQLISSLSNPGSKSGSDQHSFSVAIGKSLRAMCLLRVDSDYKLNLDISVKQLIIAKDTCDVLLTRLR